MADPARRAELASFLRSRREALDPVAAGLQPGPRRRTPGLRREEVAQLNVAVFLPADSNTRERLSRL